MRRSKVRPDDHRRYGTTFALALLACLAPSLAAAQVDCLHLSTPIKRLFTVQSRYVGVYGSHDLAVANATVKRAVIMIHGKGQNALGYYNTLVDSACLAEGTPFTIYSTSQSILLAPHFESAGAGPGSNFHSWEGDDWARGDHSVVSPTVSSYGVIDAIINQLVGPRSPTDRRRRFPNLEMIVVAGHSAGGQFTHRYAATNGRDGSIPGVRIRYVVANPSSYLYLDDQRPLYNGSSGVGVPYRISCSGFSCAWVTNPGFLGAPLCPGSYNEWRYGLTDLNTYAGAVGAATIRTRLISRNVAVLVGTLDNDPNADDLDTTCPAKLQGPDRYERGHRLLDYMDERFPDHRHWIVNVDGAGHSAFEMFVKPVGGAGTGSAVLFYDF